MVVNSQSNVSQRETLRKGCPVDESDMWKCITTPDTGYSYQFNGLFYKVTSLYNKDTNTITACFLIYCHSRFFFLLYLYFFLVRFPMLRVIMMMVMVEFL